jgi:hypothetical protein
LGGLAGLDALDPLPSLPGPIEGRDTMRMPFLLAVILLALPTLFTIGFLLFFR